MKNQKNMRVLRGLALIIAFSSFLFTSCKKGDIGPAGPAGANGATGASGANGANGSTGANGNTILSGEGAPDITLGVIGDFYLDITATALYGPKTAAGWGSPVSLKGDKGDAGNAAATSLVDTFSFYTDDWMMSDDVYAQHDNNTYTTYTAKYCKRYIPDLTQDILDHGMVLVSFTPSKANEPSQWLPIPYSLQGYDANGTNVNYNWTYVTGEHTLRVQFYLTPLANVVYYPFPYGIASTTSAAATGGSSTPDIADFNVPDARYKVVLIPATVTQEITAITKKQFTKTGKVLSTF